jgi:hypothetical protein
MPWRQMLEWRYSSPILNHSARWRWVVSFTPWPLYSPGKSPRYPLDRRLGGPCSWSGLYGEENNLAPTRIWTPAIQPIAIPTPWKCHTCTKSFYFYLALLCVCLCFSVWKSVRLNLPVFRFSQILCFILIRYVGWSKCVRFEVLTVMTVKLINFWDVMLCGLGEVWTTTKLHFRW